LSGVIGGFEPPPPQAMTAHAARSAIAKPRVVAILIVASEYNQNEKRGLLTRPRFSRPHAVRPARGLSLKD
jgi:hypothetical protein